MHARFTWAASAIFAVLFFSCWQNADAVIKADTPLKAIEASSEYIIVGKVEKFFADKPAMLLAVTEDIKGKTPFRQMPINCKVSDAKTAKTNLIEPLMKRFGPDQEMIFFIYRPRVGEEITTYITFGFVNGTWFQVIGTQTDAKDKVVFSLKSAEPYFRKTFHGTTDELRKLLKDHAAKKGMLPALENKVEPGLGPEYAPKQKTRAPAILEIWRALNQPVMIGGQGSLFAVIPTIGLGAPLAILALLFPTVFGGVFVLFRQWMAFITLISINSTLVLLQWGLDQSLRGSWWGTPAALWFLMTMCAFACTLWAWRRQLDALAAGDPEAPQRTELAVLGFMTLCCTGATVVMAVMTKTISWVDVGWTMTVVMTLGVAAGLGYRLYRDYHGISAFDAPALPTEGVILGTMLFGHLALAPGIWRGVGLGGAAEGSDAAGELASKIAPVIKKWDFAVDLPGLFASPPLVDGDAVYAAYSESTPRAATMIRFDRHTGEKKWQFIGKRNDLVQMISAPCLADGKLFFGEGWHDDPNCKVYCVNAVTGKEVWRFQTAGQTESSPTVANGKVYIGAGNVGVYCLDAKTGAELWNYPPEGYKDRLLRFGGGMTVVNNRLYCGTGVDRNETTDKGETAAFCFDAANGKLLWKTATPYPVWSTPVVVGGLVYVTTGNGDVFEDAKSPDVPGGAALCLDAQTGEEKWRFTTPNGIIAAPAVGAGRIYFGCRDAHLYCVGRFDGEQRWKRFLDSPVVASPVLDIDPDSGRLVSVFAAASGGKIGCYDPYSAHRVWSYSLADQQAIISASPRLVVTRTSQGIRRQLYFGCGLGGGIHDVAANRPVFYCLEDVVAVE